MTRIVHKGPTVDITNHAAKETAYGMKRTLDAQTGKRHTVEWADDYNDYSATGHYNIVEH